MTDPRPETQSWRKVSVVIPCLNAAGTLPILVHALRAQILPAGVELEILVVDNGSTDGSPDIAASLPARLVSEPKPGPAAARNAGARASTGDIILFLDADTRPADCRLICEHLETLATYPQTGIAGGAITHDPTQPGLLPFAENATGQFNWHDRLPERRLTFQPTPNMALRRSLFEAVGPFDENLLWLEDFDYCHRVRYAGYEIRFNPRARVFIHGRESFGAIMTKFYRWGLNVRAVYAQGRRDQFWLFPDQPRLFWLNGPIRALNETWVTLKRWLPVYPVRILLALPLILTFRLAWAWGMMSGTPRVEGRDSTVQSGGTGS